MRSILYITPIELTVSRNIDWCFLSFFTLRLVIPFSFNKTEHLSDVASGRHR